MSDTTHTASSFRHGPSLSLFVGCIAVLAGLALRIAATDGELWLDEVWSLLKVSNLSNPIEIFTEVKHDNNHLLNSLWMWVWGPLQEPFVYRIPSLLCSAGLLLLILWRGCEGESSRSTALWVSLIAFSYPLTLYGTEARGYALTLLCAALAFISLTRLETSPVDRRAILTFAFTGIVGCLSHAIYALFLAPSVLWLLWRATRTPMIGNSRAILWSGVVPPVMIACALTLTFYRNMEIGGAPLLPYLEVAASTTSVSFGGETLSSINPEVAGWNLFLGLTVTLVCIAELVAWIRSGSAIAWLVALILITPWIAVSVLQPHFILPRYFIIQILFAYLLAARFLDRLTRQGRLGAAIGLLLVGGFIIGNASRALTLAEVGRSHFVAIFESIAPQDEDGTVTVGGDQDFQNNLRLSYARTIAPHTSRISYISNYRNAVTPPRFIVRETLETYEFFPSEFTSAQGMRYHEVQRYRAPQLNGSHVTVYELTK